MAETASRDTSGGAAITRVSAARTTRTSVALLLAALAILLIRAVDAAWVGEDAFITFRVIDNFVNGLGLRWNVDERVMTYTHPLWMFTNAAAYFFTREAAYTTTAIGLAFTVATYCLVWSRLGERPIVLAATLLLPWACSATLIRYATSGFETSLTILLIAIFGVSLFSKDARDDTAWGWIGLSAGLMATNRPDTLLLCGTPLALLVLSERKHVRWKPLVLGFIPLVACIAFNMLYYGFPYPNTAPAKLHADFPAVSYVRAGFGYATDLVHRDPVSAAVLVVAAAVTAVCGLRRREHPSDWLAGRIAGLGTGMLLYRLYVVRIGGDFLSGRFWVPPVFAGLMVLSFGWDRVAAELQSRPKATGLTLALVAVLSAGAYFAAASLAKPGLIHERSLAHLRLQPDLTWKASKLGAAWHGKGVRYAADAAVADGKFVAVHGVIGFTGYASGPEVTLIDPFGIGDALIARIPLDPKRRAFWGVGHLVRQVPTGYLEARRTGNLDEMDPSLRNYYEKLSLVTAGPLLDGERLATILGFQLGRYDYLLRDWWRRAEQDPSG